ncbi:hypothetical protein DAI22_08g194133 [Oryza sativa Japonica Group]|nr:hypothetical protein DAI22_08g194133 [Oryza sativa Japonica Group]
MAAGDMLGFFKPPHKLFGSDQASIEAEYAHEACLRSRCGTAPTRAVATTSRPLLLAIFSSIKKIDFLQIQHCSPCRNTSYSASNWVRDFVHSQQAPVLVHALGA